MTAAAEAEAWHAWQREKTAQVFAAAAAREAIEDRREEEAWQERVEAKRDHDFEAFRAAMTGEPPRTIGAILADLAAIPDRPWWDPTAPPGSEHNPERLGGNQRGGQPEPRRSATAEMDALLARAREVTGDREMLRRCAEYHERELARSAGGWGGEITR